MGIISYVEGQLSSLNRNSQISTQHWISRNLFIFGHTYIHVDHVTASHLTLLFSNMPTIPTRCQCEFLMWQKSSEILTALCSNAMPSESFVKVTVTPCRRFKSLLFYLTYTDAYN